MDKLEFGIVLSLSWGTINEKQHAVFPNLDSENVICFTMTKLFPWFCHQLPQMPSRYDLQLGELIKCMLCRRPEDRPDVKLILRQPYIKQQIAMFLEATKE